MHNKSEWNSGLTKWAGQRIQYYEELESTNLTAGQAGDAGACHGTVILADRQTKGRGRRGRTWESPPGKNLYFSLLLRPSFALEKASMLTLVMAHSVARAVENCIAEGGRLQTEQEATVSREASVGIKWPNDILINGKKVCGILTELKAEKGKIQHMIIGVGINVKSQLFTGELEEKASFLEGEFGREISRTELLQKVLECFEEDYEAFEREGNLAPLHQTYEEKLLNKNALVKVLDPKGSFEGISKGITTTGELIVEKPDGEVCMIYAGEVSVRGLQGYL